MQQSNRQRRKANRGATGQPSRRVRRANARLASGAAAHEATVRKNKGNTASARKPGAVNHW